MTTTLRTMHRAAHQTLVVVVALHFILYAGYVVPIHVLSHAAESGCSVTQLTGHCCDHSAHNPKTCQICLSHGQVQTLVSECLITVEWAMAERLTRPAPLEPAAYGVPVVAPRAPPLV